MDIVKPGDAGVGGTSVETPPAPTTTDEPVKPTEPEGEKTTESKETKLALKLPAGLKPPAKTGRFQARISDLVSQRDRAMTEVAQMREQLSRMRGPASTDGKTATDAKTPDPNAPLNPEDFETYGEYVQALVERTMAQKEAAGRSDRAEHAYNEYRQEKLDAFNTHGAKLAEIYGEGFWDAITDPALPITEVMADAVLELDDMGPYAMLWLAAHCDEALKIARMNPRQATIAIGRLASQLDQEIKAMKPEGGAAQTTETPPATPPQTPPGIPKPSPVPIPRGSAPSVSEGLPKDTDTVEEWLRKETDRLRRVNPNAKFYGSRIIVWLALCHTVML